MTSLVVIDLPWIPPSLNQIRGEHWRTTHDRRKDQKADVQNLLRVERFAAVRSLVATAVVFARSTQRKDEDNFRSELSKVVGDALVQGGWLPDDTPEHFRFGAVAFERSDRYAPGTRRRLPYTILTLT